MVWSGLSLLVSVTFLSQPTVLEPQEGQSHHTRSQGVSETYKHAHVYSRTEDLPCPQSQMAVVSRGRATLLDPGQVISLQRSFCCIGEFSSLSHHKVSIVVFKTDLIPNFGTISAHCRGGVFVLSSSYLTCFATVTVFSIHILRVLFLFLSSFFPSSSLCTGNHSRHISMKLENYIYVLIINEASRCSNCEQRRR